MTQTLTITRTPDGFKITEDVWPIPENTADTVTIGWTKPQQAPTVRQIAALLMKGLV